VTTIDTIIFDMDGVITTEEKYWACARLTLWELVTQTLHLAGAFGDAVNDSVEREAVAPDDLIYALKSRAINSNWDVAYVLSCIYMAALPGVTVFSALEIPDLLEAIADTAVGPSEWPQALSYFLAKTRGVKGRVLIQEAGNRLQRAIELDSEGLLDVEGPLWWYLHDRFQRWYSGEAMQELGVPPLSDGTVIPDEQIKSTLSKLQEEGYILGAATGRPLDELNHALDGLGLLDFFDQSRLSTFDIVRQAEQKLGMTGLQKPHPLSLLRAVYPRADLRVLVDEEFQKIRRDNVVVVGDSTTDVMMAKSAGCRVVGVLTGVRGEAAREERHQLLVHSGCEAILDDVTQLPDWLEGQEL